MYDSGPHSFDTRGFKFGVIFLAVIVNLFAAVHYGTALASDRVVAQVQADSSVESKVAEARIQEQIEAFKAANAPRVTLEKQAPPKLSAKSYLIADVKTGEIYASHDAFTPRPIASISKLVTALAGNDVFNASSTLSINKEDRRRTEGTPGSIGRDESFSYEEIVQALLMESNNSAAYTIEREAGGEKFIQLMREKAKEAGMLRASFEDPSGISANNKASAADLFALTRFIDANSPEILETTRIKSSSITANSGRKYPLRNFNHYSSEEHFRGGKTGYTDAAKETMTTIFEMPFGETTAQVVIIVLGSEDRTVDINKLRSWFEKNAHIE